MGGRRVDHQSDLSDRCTLSAKLHYARSSTFIRQMSCSLGPRAHSLVGSDLIRSKVTISGHADLDLTVMEDPGKRRGHDLMGVHGSCNGSLRSRQLSFSDAINSMPGSHGHEFELPATTNCSSKAAWLVPAATRDNGRLLAAAYQLSRARPHAPEPGDGATAVAGARPLTATLKRVAVGGRLCPDLGRKRLRRPIPGADPGRSRIHAGATGALPGRCRRSPVEPHTGE